VENVLILMVIPEVIFVILVGMLGAKFVLKPNSLILIQASQIEIKSFISISNMKILQNIL